MKKTTNLDELKDKLYAAFDKAIDKANEFISGGYSEKGAQLLDSASEAAKALALVEREQRKAKERAPKTLDKN